MNKRIRINVITNLLAMIISLSINFLVTPILTKNLGMGAYSYVGIITNFLSFFTVLTYTLNSMVGRFYTVSYNEDKNLANRYISSALGTCFIIAVALLPILIIISYNLENFINIDKDLVADVKFAFLLSSITFMLSIFASIFTTGAYSKNRLEISNTVNIIASISKAVLIVLLFKFFDAHIWYLGLSTIVQNIIIIFLGYITFRKLIPDVKFSIKLFDIKCVGILLSAGLFNSVILLGRNLMTQIDLLVGNRYIDSDLMGKYAVILLFVNTLRSLATALSSAFSPTTINHYARGDLRGVVKNSNSAVNFSGTILGWPISIISSIGIYFLSIWLNEDFSEFKYIIILMMIPLNINLSMSQLNVVNQATNNLKVPALFAIISGIINLVLAIILTIKLGLWGIVIASTLAFSLNNLILLPIYTAKITGQKLNTYYLGLVKPLISNVITCAIGLIIVNYYSINNIVSLLIQCVILTIIYFTIVFIFLNKEQKVVIRSKITLIREKLHI
ncbi:polysaccharide biosynthesis C-terminal domain-containing protein [Bacillus mesophilum]|uniref:Oligosaccharide flippase family protein n=1 Tax=Bacillus mesophilum TaxID=1071718 RepID=A0A7V7RLD6_9BACI|nr:polysaccharide biosynthesis C-terminal domain-containing protein [Bacillus mesophilum]KAB2332606.1 oligosaccharide flippase family protein [Bacillus mesophilum]